MHSGVVIITGAAGGIGLAIAKTFLSAGYTVVILDLEQDGVDAAIAALGGSRVTGYACDVTHEENIQKIVGAVYDQYGSIDVLVNNAGLQHVAPIEAFPTEKFRCMINVMLIAPFIAIRHVLPYMKKSGFGRIINMASINGLVGFAGKAAYNSAKHGLIGLTKVAALESAGYGITVNAVCPGYVDTALVRNQLNDIAQMRNIPFEKVLEEVIYPLVPQKRLLSAEEVAHYVYFLAGDNAKGITGQAVVIDGGYTVQ
ncbi:3-hydroxybutyrate dehydrogenase [Agriterribacter sp.]|uniref:3-hydroxybutyrate dehydrogenase n=1 Tax=Agriterribacter sp. TaxID=2821509 RepID=UPI002BE160C5|nr:3-hydroxybutyrate dehydrogenase [Agriterribacter sp.]HRO46511.1 3-hydroxybutyrate dehydrogenase [Agriterribacter sp.]HRQ17560.1 3-hydroxybutyrate dehydrogenase [Agriterribacter sp.]